MHNIKCFEWNIPFDDYVFDLKHYLGYTILITDSYSATMFTCACQTNNNSNIGGGWFRYKYYVQANP